jgi:hypothetical protein
MSDFPSEFVDVSFPEQAESFGYAMGDLGKPSLPFMSAYEDAVTVLSDQEIDNAIDEIEATASGADFLVSRIMNQRDVGSCVAFACTQAHQIAQAKQYGINNVVQLSGISLYKNLGNVTKNSGALVSWGLATMEKDGILPLDTEANRLRFGSSVMAESDWNARYPSNWKTVAGLFRSHEWHTVKTLAGLMSALCRRDPVIVGRESHSICYTAPTRYRGARAVRFVNSWSEAWGGPGGNFSTGFGVDTLNQVKKSAEYCFVLRSVNVADA